MKRPLYIALLLFLLSGALGCLVIAGGALYFRHAGPLASDTTLIITAGTSSHNIANNLADAGVIRYPGLFVISAKLFGYRQKLRAGEYLFTAHMSPVAILDMLASGRAIIHRFTVPEGTASAKIVQQLNEEQALVGELSIEDVQEGELLPDTYFFSYGEQKKQLTNRMRIRMKETVEKLWPTRQPDLPLLTSQEMLVLASIVEKETGVEGERGKVAAVFINRLRKQMKLQSDPTVIYGITKGERDLGRLLTRSDLRMESPFNTYVIEGLPPAPIANPGKAAIEAVLNPSATNALYFVADGKGGHRFSATLDEHNRHVDEYWRGRRAASPSP